MKRLLVIAAGAALSLLAATSVFGHASLISSDPPDGGTIPTPYTLTATFDEELTPDGSSIVVQNSSAAQVASGSVSATDDKVMTAVLPKLTDGQYAVLWTAVTADDNAVERGTYHFTVGPPIAAGTISPVTPAPTPGNAGTGTGSNDVLIALALAAVVVAAVLAFLLIRNRR